MCHSVRMHALQRAQNLAVVPNKDPSFLSLPPIIPVEPPFHTYREQIRPLYRGLALWNPHPGPESGHLQQHCDWSEELPNGNHMTLKVDDNVIAAGSVFKDDVRSSLPYVEIVTLADYRYEGVLIDEERILGLRYVPELLVVSVLLVLSFCFLTD